MREKIEAASKARAEEAAARHKQMLEEEKRIREKAEAARHKQMLELGNEALARAAEVEYRLRSKSEEAKATAIAREEAEYREALQAHAAKLEEQTARVGRLLEERKFLNQIILDHCMPATASCQESPFAPPLLAEELGNPAGAVKRIFEARAKLKITELELHHAKIMLEELIKRMELHQA